jgi:hypothetical protein
MEGRDVLARFGHRVRGICNAQRLSQEEFAGLCKLDRTNIGGIDRGVQNVSRRNTHDRQDNVRWSCSSGNLSLRSDKRRVSSALIRLSINASIDIE